MIYSFSKRVLINDRRTRLLLATYARKGLSDVEMEELRRLIDHNAPFLTALIEHLDEEFPSEVHHCSRNWIKFVQCISSTSPVCALIPPTDEALELVEELCKRDVTSDPEVYTYSRIHAIVFIVFIVIESKTYSRNDASSF